MAAWAAASAGVEPARGDPNWERPRALRVAPPPPVTTPGPLLERALDYLGYPYAFGGHGDPAFDCSGFVCRVFAESGWALPRVSRDQFRAGRAVPRDALRPGDLVFFAERGRPISHVGIYLGDGAIVHASSGRGEVVVADLGARWFRTRFAGARRVLTSTPALAAPPVVATEIEEHRGGSALLPMVDRPGAFPEPRVGFRLAGETGSGLHLRALGASEGGRWAPVLVPEASLVLPDWGFELTAAVPIRFEPQPEVGAVENFADATRFLRRLRLGLPGARLELALERTGSYRLADTRLLRDLSPGALAAGVPGLSVARSPLAAYGAFRPRMGAVEVLVDDVIDPGVAGLGLIGRPHPLLEVFAAGVTDLRAQRIAVAPTTGARGFESVDLHGAAAGFDLRWRRRRRFEIGLRAEGQALASPSGWGVGGVAEVVGRLRVSGRVPTTVGLDLGGGAAADGFLFDLFGPTYLPNRTAHVEALSEIRGPRGVIVGRGFVRRGPWALHLGYQQALGPAAAPLDRQSSAALELGGLSLGGRRTLELRLGHAARAPFDPARGLHVFSATARLRWSSWLAAELFAQAGETFEAGGGLTVTWLP